MKKSLLALAVLGAFAGAASAQSNVTIYGVADIGLERTDLSPGAATTRLTSGIQSGSRIGFKGKEDLGGGMSASFQLENGFGLDTGALGTANTIFNRQAWVGIGGGFGTVKFGRQYNPLFNAIDTIDPFATGITGDGSGAIAVFRSYGVRNSNTINYSTSAMGLSAEVSYALGEVAGNSSAGRELGFGLGYANGPVAANVAYFNQKNATNTATAKTAFVGGAYDLKVAKIHAAFADNRDSGATSARSRDWLLGVSAPVGAGTVLASYIRHDERQGVAADADFAQVGYTHSLSKRTNLYTSYSKLNSKPAGTVDTSWLNVGIRHLF